MLTPMRQQFGQGGMAQAYNNQNRNPFAMQRQNWNAAPPQQRPPPSTGSGFGLDRGMGNDFAKNLWNTRAQYQPQQAPPSTAPGQVLPEGMTSALPMGVGWNAPQQPQQPPQFGGMPPGNQPPQAQNPFAQQRQPVNPWTQMFRRGQ